MNGNLYIEAFLIFVLLSAFAQGGKVDYKANIQCTDNSMKPEINCTNTIILNTVGRYDNLTINNIYCYYPDYRNYKYLTPGDRICHRLIDMQGDMYYFKGDNKPAMDEPIERKYVSMLIVGIE